MHIDVFSVFRNTADFSGVLLYYNGPLSQNVIATMGEILRHRLGSADAGGPKARKLFSSFIEMAQNALHYSPDAPGYPGEKIGAVAVGRRGSGDYYIVFGNLVHHSQSERIRDRIEPLRSMTVDEIRNAYREQLRQESCSDAHSKGAGLGFLTLARDAAEPIEYSLIDLSGEADDLAYFYIQATV
ncbi:MAG: SiaB family protein kinase [Betaproteobacteria bacterium]|nr:SiaB family protein kinase [Betaproteobacteria bacterium]